MGGKKTSEENKRFEKFRRDKLNAAFDELVKLLPEYDPSVNFSKIEILKKAAAYIKELRVKNDEIMKMGPETVLKEESERLKKRVTSLVFKTQELVDALKKAGVAFPIKNTKKKIQTSNQNKLGAAGGDKGKCICQLEKTPLKEVNVGVCRKLVDHTLPDPVLVPDPKVSPVSSSSAQTNLCFTPAASDLSCARHSPDILTGQSIEDGRPLKPSIKSSNGVSTSSFNIQHTQSSSEASISVQNIQLSPPSGQNVPVVEKNILPNFGAGTLILTDGRIVSVPQILPQIVVKQPPTVILMPAAKKKEKMIIPKFRDVTKTTFTRIAPIPSLPSFRLDSSKNTVLRNKPKSNLKRDGKIRKVNLQVRAKKKKLEVSSNCSEDKLATTMLKCTNTQPEQVLVNDSDACEKNSQSLEDNSVSIIASTVDKSITAMPSSGGPASSDRVGSEPEENSLPEGGKVDISLAGSSNLPETASLLLQPVSSETVLAIRTDTSDANSTQINLPEKNPPTDAQPSVYADTSPKDSNTLSNGIFVNENEDGEHTKCSSSNSDVCAATSVKNKVEVSHQSTFNDVIDKIPPFIVSNTFSESSLLVITEPSTSVGSRPSSPIAVSSRMTFSISENTGKPSEQCQKGETNEMSSRYPQKETGMPEPLPQTTDKYLSPVSLHANSTRTCSTDHECATGLSVSQDAVPDPLNNSSNLPSNLGENYGILLPMPSPAKLCPLLPQTNKEGNTPVSNDAVASAGNISVHNSSYSPLKPLDRPGASSEFNQAIFGNCPERIELPTTSCKSLQIQPHQNSDLVNSSSDINDNKNNKSNSNPLNSDVMVGNKCTNYTSTTCCSNASQPFSQAVCSIAYGCSLSDNPLERNNLSNFDILSNTRGDLFPQASQKNDMSPMDREEVDGLRTGSESFGCLVKEVTSPPDGKEGKSQEKNCPNTSVISSNNSNFPSYPVTPSAPGNCALTDISSRITASSVLSQHNPSSIITSNSFIDATSSKADSLRENIYSSVRVSDPASGMDPSKPDSRQTSGQYSKNFLCNEFGNSNKYNNQAYKNMPSGSFPSTNISGLSGVLSVNQTSLTNSLAQPPIFTSLPDVRFSSESASSLLSPAPAGFGFPSRSSNSLPYSISANTSSYPSHSSYGTSFAQGRGFNLDSNSLKTSTSQTPNSLVSTPYSSLHTSVTSSRLTYMSSTTANPPVPGVYSSVSGNVFNNVSSSANGSIQAPFSNLSANYSLSSLNQKSPTSSPINTRGIPTSSFQSSSNSKTTNNILFPRIPTSQIILSEANMPFSSVYSTIGKSPIFTQANGSVAYSSSGRLQTFTTEASLSSSVDPPSHPVVVSSSSLSLTSSLQATKIFKLSNEAPKTGPGRLETAYTFTSTANSNIGNVQCNSSTLNQTSSILNSNQNEISAKSVQTNLPGIYPDTFNPEGGSGYAGKNRVFSQNPLHNPSTYNVFYSSSSAPIESAPLVCSLAPTDPTIASSTSFSGQSAVYSSHVQETLASRSASFVQPDKAALNKAQFCHQNSLNMSHYEKEDNRSSGNNSNRMNRNDVLASSGRITDCDQHAQKKSDLPSSSNSNLCSTHSEEHSKEKNFFNQLSQNKSVLGNVTNGLKSGSVTECGYLQNKNDPLKNWTTISNGTSKETSSISRKTSYSVNFQSSTITGVNTNPSSNQPDKSADPKINNSNQRNPLPTNSVEDGCDLRECLDKSLQSTCFTGALTINNQTSSKKTNENLAEDKSSRIENSRINYSCNIPPSRCYSETFQSQNTNPSKLPNSSFHVPSYSNRDTSTYDLVNSQYNNGIVQNSLNTGVSSSKAIPNTIQVFEKNVPLNNLSEAVTEKQSNDVPKPYQSGSTLKPDMHLDFLKTRDLDKNTFIPIGYDDMRLASEFSSDLFSSLQVPAGGQHSESISPTAAFLLAFPLVSTSRAVESLHDTDNHENQTSTPTTILQIGNIDPPSSELFQPMDFQKNSKSGDQYDINNDYLQLHELPDKQSAGFKGCEKRREGFSDFSKDVRSAKQKTKSNQTTINYNNSYSNPMLTCNEYQFCEKDTAQWQNLPMEYPSDISKEPKKMCDRRKDRTTQKVYYPQGFQESYNCKDKKRKQQNNISVNWMSTPEKRAHVEYQQKDTDSAMVATTVCSGMSFDYSSESFPDLSNPKKTNNYSWSPSKTFLPSLDSQLMIPSTLPTLVGDLALGTTTPSETYKSFETPRLNPISAQSKKQPEKFDETKKCNDFSKNQGNFFSVSQLVDPKSKKQKTGERVYKKPDKNSKARNNFPCSKRKEEQWMCYDNRNSFFPSHQPEKRNPHKGSSYSAESLIGANSLEMDFPSTFTYQQNTNYFQNEFSNPVESSNQQYIYFQQTNVGFNQEECQDLAFGMNQRGPDGGRLNSARKEDSSVRQSAGHVHPSSCSKPLHHPPHHPNTTTTLTNFNLSTIFPEMNDQRVGNSGHQPAASYQDSYRSH